MYRDRFSDRIKYYIADDEWIVAETEYDPEKNLMYETLFALTSGKMGNRATHPEGFIRRELPANYVHGVFDRSEAFQRELCNTPNWNLLKMYYKTEPIGPESGRELKDFIRILDMKHGFVATHYITIASDGRETLIESIKLLSRSDPECARLRFYVTPLNYGGLLEFENIIDATVTNFMDYPRFRVKHLNTREIGPLEDSGIYVQSETRDFLLPLTTVADVKVTDQAGNDIIGCRQYRGHGEQAVEFFDARVAEGMTICVDKFVAVVSGRDGGNTKQIAEEKLRRFMCKSFEAEIGSQGKIYADYWKRANIVIEGDPRLQLAIRFNLFHLMSTPNPGDNRTNIGAKLMHGEEYGGHAFWDTEIFMLPFFTLVFPEIAKNLVEYRYLLLDAARRNAEKWGQKGARYPWESADTGDEECPDWTIEGDGTCYRCTVAEQEVHVTADIIYGGLQYFHLTGDMEYYENNLLEMLAETARFWNSRIEYNSAKDCYEITGITGPDEWHEAVSNNAYTNYIAKWNMLTAVKHLREYKAYNPDKCRKLFEKLDLDETELEHVEKNAAKIFIPVKEGLIEQFEGYFNLKDHEIYEWDKNKMPVIPKELKGVKRADTTIIKQADVVMLLFLFDEEFDAVTKRINFDFYEKRTLHRSSLSPSIYCIMGLRVGESERAYDYLCRSAFVDIDNNQGNTREGIHAASAGGTWQALVFGYGGLSIKNDQLHFSPRLHEKWTRIRFSIVWKGDLIDIEICKDSVKLFSRRTQWSYFVDGKEHKAEIINE
ncbi:MAG TPA: glycoside hydrolase family 65 protein [Clostridiaceae bacterium]|nr:glycoside hydrolase family 65 protein [Clostridiaceae bacterium]